MGARSSNTNRDGSRSQSQNRLLNGHVANFFNSQLNAGRIGPNSVNYTSTGGDSTIEIGDHKYHVFLGTVGGGNPSPFVIEGDTAPVEFLLIGGGGGGGWDVGGGGGAGGLVHGVDKDFGIGTYTIVVGEGGAGTSSPGSAGTTGEDSTIVGHPDGTITAQGGGGGGGWSPSPPIAAGKDGGSGGGGGGYTNPGPGGEGTQPTQNPGYPDITNYGHDGGTEPGSAPTTYGGGGGGSGGAGPTSGGTKGPAQPFTNFPGPGLAPAIPAPLSPTWAPFVGASGYFGYGGEGHTDTGPDAPTSYPDCTGTGADGGGTPNAGNTGSTGICIIRVPRI